jgi:thermitase
VHHRSTSFLSLLFAFCLLLLMAWPALADHYVPGEILVRFKPGVTTNAAASAHARHKTSIMEKVDNIRVHRLKVPKGMTVEQAVDMYKADPSVEYAGPNHLLYLDFIPNDDYFDSWMQWAIYPGTNPRHDIRAAEAWDVSPTKGAGVVIAILDTGVWAQHEDLDTVGPNPKVLPGFNAVGNNYDTTDYNGHGTLIASIAAANTNNSIGVAGVAWNAKILPVKVIEGEIGNELDAAQGVLWAVDHGAKVLNMSFGGYIDEPMLHAAIDYAWAYGCLNVCSSGNDDLNTLHYPSAYDHALAVGGTDEEDARWVYDDIFFGGHYGSNYGPWLDVMAPGSNITGAYIEEDWLLELGFYTIASGTSASSPHVSGIAAMIWALHPTWTNEQVFQQIVASCDDLGPSGWDIQTGFGRVNAQRALTLVQVTAANIKAMKLLANGTRVTLRDRVVTSKPEWISNRIYLEEPDRSSGILVYGVASPPAMDEGSIVDVTGTLSEVSGERALTSATVSNVRSGTPLRPLLITSRDVGGKQLGAYQMGVDKGRGVNNLGLLIRCSGRVHYSDFAHFYIDDGYNFKDGSGNTGLRVAWGETKPEEGQLVVVTGISGCEIPDGASVRIRTLRMRKLDDIWPPITP